MKKVLPTVLFIVASFFLGYLYASKMMLTTEFVEVNSNALSRPFLEHSSLYKVLRQGQLQKVENILEALIFSDLVAMGEVDFSNTSNSEILCARLNELNKLSGNGVVFSEELVELLKECP